MEIKVHGRHTEVSRSLERFAAEKLSRLNRYGRSIRLIDVELYEEGRLKDGNHIAEVAVSTDGPSFRAKAYAADHRAAIDIAVDRLTRQMTDFKRKTLGKPAHARPPRASVGPELLDPAAFAPATSGEVTT